MLNRFNMEQSHAGEFGATSSGALESNLQGEGALRFSKYWGITAGLLSALFWILSIPPFDFAEAAYIAFVPLFLWLYTKPTRRVFWLVAIGAAWVSWFVILIWLRHVTWFGTIVLSGILAVISAAWLFFAKCILPQLVVQNILLRTLGFAGIAGAWVVLEWSRTWVFGGFPWAPLALSQWERPVVLQIAAWSGAYGVSFLLIFFNLCLAQTLRHRFMRRERKLWMGWFSPDLYVGMGALGFCIYIFFLALPRPDSAERMFTAAVVQPYIVPELKWDINRELENLEILERQTRFVSSLESDVILWPEAATPWPVMGTPQMQVRVERLVDEIEKPILMGNLAEDRVTKEWRNGVFLVKPGAGLSSDSYTKRELVPFGEYVPPILSFIDKFVPVGGRFIAGDEVCLMNLSVGGSVYRIGSLICYEDVFSNLARESARGGADLFFVATNNAWYGEEGGAEQHAAHSVLRAVENRRPVMRAGNGGWSGWIDSYGTIRDLLVDAEGSIYFRGGGTYTIVQFEEWSRQQSYYTRYGDWFVALSGGLAGISLLLGLHRPKHC